MDHEIVDIQDLDGVGGAETQAITEFVGEFGSGKSQLCMKLSITAQLPQKDGGLEGKVLFIEEDKCQEEEARLRVTMGNLPLPLLSLSCIYGKY